jgi:hypothetical protein
VIQVVWARPPDAPLILPGRNKMRHPRRLGPYMVLANALAYLTIGHSRAAMLAQVLGPRLHQEKFDVTAGIRGVAE